MPIIHLCLWSSDQPTQIVDFRQSLAVKKYSILATDYLCYTTNSYERWSHWEISLIGLAHKEKYRVTYPVDIKDIESRYLRYCKLTR